MEKFRLIPESLDDIAFAVGGRGNSLNSNFGSFSTQKECIFDLHEQKKKGFTLAETLITLTILGIVAALTIPNLVRRQVEASNRTKIKKAVSVYDLLMTRLVTTNDLKSNTAIQDWADDDCSNSSDLFKVIKFVSTGNNKCKFKTADGVFWDITDIQKPIIALKETDLDAKTANSDTNRAFYLFAEYDGQGILKITEPQYDYTLTSDKEEINGSVDRLMAFLSGKTTTSLEKIPKSSYDKFLAGDYNQKCEDIGKYQECTATNNIFFLQLDNNKYSNLLIDTRHLIFKEKGKMFGFIAYKDSSGGFDLKKGSYAIFDYDDNDEKSNIKYIRYDCDKNFSNCTGCKSMNGDTFYCTKDSSGYYLKQTNN